MARVIFFSKRAQLEIEQVLGYWHQHNQSPEYPRKIASRLMAVTETLALFPEIGTLHPIHPWRRFVFEQHFLLLYKHDQHQLIILRFWDTRQDPDHLTP